jgi:hypothetical protein
MIRRIIFPNYRAHRTSMGVTLRFHCAQRLYDRRWSAGCPRAKDLLRGEIPDFIPRAAGAHQQMVDIYDWSVFALTMVVMLALVAASWCFF